MSHVLEIFQAINSYWDRLNGLSNDDPTAAAEFRYYLGQILTYFEVVSYLVNRGVISKTASDISSSHTFEIWERINASESYKRIINELISSETTFEQTKIMVNSRKSAPKLEY